MSNSIFQYENKTIRTAGTTDKPMFCAQDVCEVLSLDNNRQAVSKLDDDEKITVINSDGNPRSGIPHQMTYVTESGLYSLILLSRKPEAKKFRKWITSEVIPSIRKTGQYSTNAAPPTTGDLFLDSAAQGLRLASNIVAANPEAAASTANRALDLLIGRMNQLQPTPTHHAPPSPATKRNQPRSFIENKNDSIRHAESFLMACVSMILNTRPEARRFMRVIPTTFSEDGYILRIDTGTLHLWISPKELHQIYMAESRLLGKHTDTNLIGIQRELRKQPFYVRSINKPNSWKRKLPDDNAARIWWLLDTSLMPTTLSKIIHPLYPS